MHALLAHVLAMLGGDHDRIRAHRLAVLVSEAHLALGVGTELGRAAGVPRLGHLMQDAVGIEDRRRHQRLGFAAGIAEHDALIARALILLRANVGIDAAGDVGGLLMHVILKLRQVPVEALLLVADLAHGAPRRGLDQLGRHALGPAHLARHDDAVGGDQASRWRRANGDRRRGRDRPRHRRCGRRLCRDGLPTPIHWRRGNSCGTLWDPLFEDGRPGG